MQSRASIELDLRPRRWGITAGMVGDRLMENRSIDGRQLLIQMLENSAWKLEKLRIYKKKTSPGSSWRTGNSDVAYPRSLKIEDVDYGPAIHSTWKLEVNPSWFVMKLQLLLRQFTAPYLR